MHCIVDRILLSSHVLNQQLAVTIHNMTDIFRRLWEQRGAHTEHMSVVDMFYQSIKPLLIFQFLTRNPFCWHLFQGTSRWKVPHMFNFGNGNVLMIPSSVNSSTLHELGAGEHWWDVRERERERDGGRAWLSYSFKCGFTQLILPQHTRRHPHRKKYFTCVRLHPHPHWIKCYAHPLSPRLRPSNRAGSRAPLHFR